MLEINLNPFFHLGQLQVRWAAIFTILAIAAVIIVSILEEKRYERPRRDVIIGLTISFAVGSLIGGKLFYSLDNWPKLMQNPEEVILNFAVVMYGVFIGAIASTFIYCAVKKVKLWKTFDNVSPGAMLGMAIYRIGCIISGCCYGIHSDSFCSVTYINPETLAPFGKLLYPTEIFHFIASLLVFMALWLLRKKLKPEGSLFLLMLVLLAATDLPIRLLREGEPFLFGLQQAEVIGIAILLITVPLLVITLKSGKPLALSHTVPAIK